MKQSQQDNYTHPMHVSLKKSNAQVELDTRPFIVLH